jgi:hypothetical protein
VEVFIVQLRKAIIAIVFSITIPASTALLYTRDAAGENAQHASYNDISAYYGFEEIEIIKLDWGIKDLRIADFNGDGRNDIVVANNSKARIDILIQRESIGPAKPEVAVDPNDVDINMIAPPTRFDKESIAVSQKVYSLVCGDLNSDGLTDLAFYGEPRGLYVMLQKTDDAETGKTITESLNWRTRKKIKIDDGLLTSNMLICTDLNNDGAKDLALAGQNCIYIMVQKESGSLAEPEKYPSSAQTLSVEAGDLNGDGINDLILVTNDMEKPVHVRFGVETGQLGPQVQFFIERPATFGIYDLDGTAGDEILIVDSLSRRLTCYKFATENPRDVDWPILFYPLASGQEDTKRDLATSDFNGDGLTDVVISDPGAAELIFYKQVPNIGLAEPVRFPAFADITSLSAMDIDSDGKTELGILSVKEKVIGLSSFEADRLSFPQPLSLIGEPVAMELADVDGNGSVDCSYVSKDDNDIRSIRIIYNLSESEKQRNDPESVEDIGENDFTLKLQKLTSNPDGLRVIDVDQDGLQDILIFVSYEIPILVHQVEKDNFEIVDSPRAQSSLIKDASLRSIAVADVDDKAGNELLVAQNNFARSLVFSPDQSWNIIDQYNAKSTENEISAVAAFMMNSENPSQRPAILLLDGQKGQLQILKAGDDMTYRVESELDIGRWNVAAHLKMLFEPLTGSEAKSILLFDSGKFALVTPPCGDNVTQYLEQQFSYETKIKDGIYGNLTAGDINSDNRTDIVMVEYKQNHVEILALDADDKPIPAMRFKIFEQKSHRDSERINRMNVEPRELRIADVTGDGKEDLVTVIHDRVIIYPQD